MTKLLVDCRSLYLQPFIENERIMIEAELPK